MVAKFAEVIRKEDTLVAAACNGRYLIIRRNCDGDGCVHFDRIAIQQRGLIAPLANSIERRLDEEGVSRNFRQLLDSSLRARACGRLIHLKGYVHQDAAAFNLQDCGCAGGKGAKAGAQVG